MSLKKKFRLLHLYLGLVSGLIVFVEAVTGAAWVFQEEIKSLTATPREIVASGSTVVPTVVRRIAQNALPGKHIHGVVYPNEPEAPLEVIFYEPDPVFYQSAFIHPTSGEILEIVDHKAGFFAFMMDGHTRLWLPSSIGAPIVAYGTLIFFISIVTGLILWWPKKRKKAIKQRFVLDWKPTTQWRRKNFDLHTVIGFYISAFALVFVITGLTMALPWFGFIYYKAIGGSKDPFFIVPQNHSAIALKVSKEEDLAINRLPQLLAKEHPKATSFEIHYPQTDSSSIYIEVTNSAGLFYDADYVFKDQNTLEDLPTTSLYGKYADADTSDKVARMTYDLHIGSILGLPTKIIAFLASMIVASMPVTGLLIWIGRKKKRRSEKRRSNKEQKADSKVLVA